MYTKSGIQAYAQVGVESAVLSASPHQLVVLLFDGALSAMKKAAILIAVSYTHLTLPTKRIV